MSAAKSVDEIHAHSQRLLELAKAGLNEIPGLILHYPNSNRVGTISFEIEGFDSRELATILSSSFGIQTRSGYHCAPRVHNQLETVASGGAVRISFGYFNSTLDVTRLVDAMKEISGVAQT